MTKTLHAKKKLALATKPERGPMEYPLRSRMTDRSPQSRHADGRAGCMRPAPRHPCRTCGRRVGDETAHALVLHARNCKVCGARVLDRDAERHARGHAEETES